MLWFGGTCVSCMQVFLSAACANPNTPLAALAMMSPTEHQQVLQAFNDTGLPPAMPKSQGFLVHHQFMRQAAARPDAPCLVYEGEVLSYSQVCEEQQHTHTTAPAPLPGTDVFCSHSVRAAPRKQHVQPNTCAVFIT